VSILLWPLQLKISDYPVLTVIYILHSFSLLPVVLVQRLNEVGENIRNYRKEKKLTQKELGNMCVFSEAMIKQYELGIRTIYII